MILVSKQCKIMSDLVVRSWLIFAYIPSRSYKIFSLGLLPNKQRNSYNHAYMLLKRCRPAPWTNSRSHLSHVQFWNLQASFPMHHIQGCYYHFMHTRITMLSYYKPPWPQHFRADRGHKERRGYNKDEDESGATGSEDKGSEKENSSYRWAFGSIQESTLLACIWKKKWVDNMGIDLVISWFRENWLYKNWPRGSWSNENWSRGSTPPHLNPWLCKKFTWMGRKQNKIGGHDGQPIPKLVGHLLHLLGHSTESRSLAISSLCLYNWEYKCE